MIFATLCPSSSAGNELLINSLLVEKPTFFAAKLNVITKFIQTHPAGNFCPYCGKPNENVAAEGVFPRGSERHRTTNRLCGGRQNKN